MAFLTTLQRTVRKALSRVPLVRNAASLYDAGSSSRRTRGWNAPTTSSNQAILSTLSTLRDRSRAATRNDGYAKGAIDKLVSNIIGLGVKPLSQAADPEFRKAAQTLWLRWTDESDADGLLDYYGQQAQAVRAWLEGGEAFVRIRPRLPEDGLVVPLQLQVLEPELCPYQHNVFSSSLRVRAGIEFNGIGRRVAYYFHPSRPELDDFDPSELRRLPAESVIHLFDPVRPGQLRGLPHLTQALVDLYELDQYDDATLLRQKLSNMFAGFIKRPPALGDSETFHPLTGEAVETSGDKPLLSLEPGIMQELDPGEDLVWSNPPAPQGYPDFMRQQLYGVAAATGVPYEVLTGDMRGVNDRTMRVLLHEFRRRVQTWQHQIVAFQFCRPVWRAWMDRVFLSGALPMPTDYLRNPEPWLRVSWTPHGWPYINPTQDVEAQKASVRAGFKSRSAVVSEQGDDAEDIDRAQADDNARADSLGLRYDSDGRQSATGSAAPAPGADPGPGRDPEPDPAPDPAGPIRPLTGGAR
jgi:lambda family phage portal protein